MSIFAINGFHAHFFLEPLGRMLQVEPLEIPQNDESEMSVGLPLGFLSCNFTAKSKE